jgi:polyisoprenoid-binding protein YceI
MSCDFSKQRRTTRININRDWSRAVMLSTLICLGMLAPSDIVIAEPRQYTADKWHTRILWNIDHMGMTNYAGRFTEFDIDFIFDEDDMSNSSAEVTVPVRSIDTFSPELNSKMPGDGFFDADEYPALHFKSTSVQRSGAKTATMLGDMTIKGVTLPVTFYVIYNNGVEHPRFKLHNVGFTATAKIDSRAFGVNPLPSWMVGSIVEVTVQLEAFEGDSVPYYSSVPQE